MNESKVYNSVRNTAFALGEQLLSNILSFVCRTVFIHSLGKTYLGFSGLFGDILTILSLAELGVGIAITYSMYEPTAKGDYRRVVGLLNEYKKTLYDCGYWDNNRGAGAHTLPWLFHF